VVIAWLLVGLRGILRIASIGKDHAGGGGGGRDGPDILSFLHTLNPAGTHTHGNVSKRTSFPVNQPALFSTAKRIDAPEMSPRIVSR